MERWVDVKGFEGLYQVSDLGRVRSLDRISSNNHFRKGRILKERNTRYGYLEAELCKGGKHYYRPIHRLVAIAFIPNPENKPTVNHIDENKQNNNVSNLEWATYKENSNHGTRTERSLKNRDAAAIRVKQTKTIRERMGKKIRQYDLNGCLIREYETLSDAVRETGYVRSGIIGVCKHKKYSQTYKGFIWEYVV